MRKYCVFLSVLISQYAFSQSPTSPQPPANWQLLDWKHDGYPGMSVEKAYAELLKGKRPQKKVIVAVIDDGFDDRNPDLAGIEFTNAKEIPGNNIDDDHNGFVDDIHGWNFIGTTRQESFEEIREYVRLRPQFADGVDSVSQKGRAAFDYWRGIVAEKDKHLQELEGTNEGVGKVVDAFKTLQGYWSKKLGTDSVYFFHVKREKPGPDADSVARQASAFLLSFADQVASTPDSETLTSIIPKIGGIRAEAVKSLFVAHTLMDKNDPAWFRRQAIHDDPYQRGGPVYGDGNTSPDDPHGTQCAGIIGALRVASLPAGDNNQVRGIANNVLIMPLRINAMGHPCDEWDKDVANAIQYAVDNGANVISMSFGKYISPQHAWVTEAIAYAEKKGVLLVHAAMNDGVDLDSTISYPNPLIDGKRRATNFITVGASSFDSTLVGGFSNYGRHTVDVFAPGVSIYMTNPGGHHSRGLGTSYACPMVSGVAAMIWSYYPQLTVQQLKRCIEASAVPIDVLVTKPHSDQKVAFRTLSTTGGIVNAYRAIQLAQALVEQH